MSERELCDRCYGSGDGPDGDPCCFCAGNGFDTFVSARPRGNPQKLAIQAIQKVFGKKE